MIIEILLVKDFSEAANLFVEVYFNEKENYIESSLFFLLFFSNVLMYIHMLVYFVYLYLQCNIEILIKKREYHLKIVPIK